MKKPIVTGELNQKIEIYKDEDQPDGAGGTFPVTTLYWATNAKAEPLKSSRFMQANVETLKDGYRFTIRYRRDKTIYPDMLLRYRGGDMTIVSAIQDDTYKEFLIITATWSRRPEVNEQP